MYSHITMKYKKKVRLLVTNKCSKNCAYCHNEGMGKLPILHLKPYELKPFLPNIKKYTNRIVLSGGEPFEYKYLQELCDMLLSYGFDLTLITANINRGMMADIGHKLKTIHCSIHKEDDLEIASRTVHWLNDTYPNIRISLNIPFDDIDYVKRNWNQLYNLSKDVGANLQFIRLFSYGTKSSSLWNERWTKMEKFLAARGQFLEGTERETTYITKDHIKVDLLDIPCLASGPDYSEGACLNNSDITIDPSLQLSICRWTDSSVPLYRDGKPVLFDAAVQQATEKSCQKCTYGTITDYLHSNVLDYYLNAPHYTWPQLHSGLHSIYSTINTSDFSYYGKSGFVALLENKFARYIGAKYSLAVNSGTTAIYLSCMALCMSPEDEVMIPVATFPTLVAALLTAGVRVRLCDIDPVTGNISIKSLRENMRSSVKAVLVTHLWGVPANMNAVREVCNKYKTYIVEDCSHAYGAEINGQKVGSLGDISCFSLQANKAVYAGEGGLLVTSNQMFYERAVAYSSSVQRILDCVKNSDYLRYWATGLGLKLKMNPLGAPLALMSLENLDEVNQKKRLRMSLIEETLANSEIFMLPETCRKSDQRVYYTYKLVLHEQYIPYRDAILQSMIHHGLEAGITSFIPVHRHDLCSVPTIVNNQEKFPNAEKYYSRIISLPAFVHEPIELVQYYAKIIKEISVLISKHSRI